MTVHTYGDHTAQNLAEDARKGLGFATIADSAVSCVMGDKK